MPTWIMQTQSVLIVLLMVIGIAKRKNRNIHWRIMSAAMIWDLILILQIELSRGAVLKASQALKNPMLLNIHVSIAVSTVILYIFMIKSGRQVLLKNQNLNHHRKLGRITFVLRVLTLITSFWTTP
jgi:uncharacterized membrane protein YozB (DUF420 family)